MHEGVEDLRPQDFYLLADLEDLQLEGVVLRFKQVDVHLLAFPADPGRHVILFPGRVLVERVQSERGVVVGIDERVRGRRVEFLYPGLEFLLPALAEHALAGGVRIDQRTDSRIAFV